MSDLESQHHEMQTPSKPTSSRWWLAGIIVLLAVGSVFIVKIKIISDTRIEQINGDIQRFLDQPSVICSDNLLIPLALIYLDNVEKVLKNCAFDSKNIEIINTNSHSTESNPRETNSFHYRLDFEQYYIKKKHLWKCSSPDIICYVGLIFYLDPTHYRLKFSVNKDGKLGKFEKVYTNAL